jgi:hypothetical protein
MHDGDALCRGHRGSAKPCETIPTGTGLSETKPQSIRHLGPANGIARSLLDVEPPRWQTRAGRILPNPGATPPAGMDRRRHRSVSSRPDGRAHTPRMGPTSNAASGDGSAPTSIGVERPRWQGAYSPYGTDKQRRQRAENDRVIHSRALSPDVSLSRGLPRHDAVSRTIDRDRNEQLVEAPFHHRASRGRMLLCVTENSATCGMDRRGKWR